MTVTVQIGPLTVSGDVELPGAVRAAGQMVARLMAGEECGVRPQPAVKGQDSERAGPRADGAGSGPD